MDNAEKEKSVKMSNINWLTVALLFASNMVMLYAWYGHLKSMESSPVWAVVLVSWGIAFFEYSLMIPANRMGSKTMNLEQLKIVQEAIALLAFVPFSVVVMRQPVSWNYAAASVCIFLAVFFVFWK